jgi:hypothetical protein
MISTLMESVEHEPLLPRGELDATEVYPVIHQIKYVSAWSAFIDFIVLNFGPGRHGMCAHAVG